MNNVGGGIASVRHKEQVLLEHCEAVGRDPAEIERTTGHRDRRHPRRPRRGGADLPRGVRPERVGQPGTDQPVGTPEDVAEKLAPYLDLGYRHLISGFPANYDEESMTRFATEVRPLLEKRLVRTSPGPPSAAGSTASAAFCFDR